MEGLRDEKGTNVSLDRYLLAAAVIKYESGPVKYQHGRESNVSMSRYLLAAAA